MMAGSCPFCGTDTGLARQPEPELCTLSMDELEALVRGEWRRRLGPAAYAEAHSAALVRALLVYALCPDSPVRSCIADQLLYRELTKYGVRGTTQREIRSEFRALLEAVHAVLESHEVAPGTTAALVTRLVDRLRAALGWWIVPPDPEDLYPAATYEIGGPREAAPGRRREHATR